MKKFTLIILLITLCSCSGYNTRINGINPNLFKERNYFKIATGVISSLVVHEASHLLYAELNGGGHFDFNEFVVVSEDYYNTSYSEQQMFHRIGFLGQLAVGSILTAIPETKHSDFTMGFNAFTAINTAIYTITGGSNKEYSDIEQLDNGTLEGSLYTIGAGILTYENLKEEE